MKMGNPQKLLREAVLRRELVKAERDRDRAEDAASNAVGAEAINAAFNKFAGARNRVFRIQEEKCIEGITSRRSKEFGLTSPGFHFGRELSWPSLRITWAYRSLNGSFSL